MFMRVTTTRIVGATKFGFRWSITLQSFEPIRELSMFRRY